MTNEEMSKKAADILSNNIKKIHEKDRATTDLVTTITTMVSMIGAGMIIEMFIHEKHWNKEMKKAEAEMLALIKQKEEEDAADEQPAE